MKLSWLQNHGVPDAETILYEELQTVRERLWKKEECYLSLENDWKDQSEQIKVTQEPKNMLTGACR